MKNKNLIRKTIFLGAWTAVTLATLTTTTYAWFAKNRNAWTDEFDMHLSGYDGLVISVDGEHFYSEIDNTNLLKAITAKRLNKSVSDVTDEDVEKCVIEISPVSTNNLVDFNTIDNNSTLEDGYYKPHTADLDSYLYFDLYFTVDASGNKMGKEYDLTFVSSKYVRSENEEENTKDPDEYSRLGLSYIKGPSSTVTLKNKLSVPTKDYDTDEEFTLNPVDAMRIGVLHEDVATIYEPYAGYGSYAIEGNTTDAYNPAKNAALTYFNNGHSSKKQMKALETSPVYLNTEKSFDNEVSFGKFTQDSATGKYNTLKITVAVWLEGYDSDYIQGADTDKMSLFLNFNKVEA